MSYPLRSLYLDEEPASPEYNISSDDECEEDSNAQDNTEDPDNEDSNAAQDNTTEEQDELKQIEESSTDAGI